MIRLLVEGVAFLLLLFSMVLLVSMYQRLPERFPLNFDANGRISEWGTPLHFIIVFGAGMLLYGGLSVLARYKNIFGIALFADEHKSRTKYEATLLLFSFLKLYSLAVFISVMCNMYVRVRHFTSVPFLDWAIFIVLGCIALTVAVYFFSITKLNRRKKSGKTAGDRA